MRVYQSLRAPSPDKKSGQDSYLTPTAAALTGHMCANSPQPGCLSSDPNVRLHSCERGNMCSVASGPSVVTIQPVVAHLPTGDDLAEHGVGGGGEDLEREAELTLPLRQDLVALGEL